MSRLDPYLFEWHVHLRKNNPKYKRIYKEELRTLLEKGDKIGGPRYNPVRKDFIYIYKTQMFAHPDSYYVRQNSNWHKPAQRVIINLIIAIINEDPIEERRGQFENFYCE